MDLPNMAKELMAEISNHLFNKHYKNYSPVQEVEGGEMKTERFIGLVQVNHLLLQYLIQIPVLQKGLPQNG